MSLNELSDRESVIKAIEEFDSLGREGFLLKYGFSRSRIYFLNHEGKQYDSKAIVGSAHGFQFGIPLSASEFSGGDKTVSRKLTEMGFSVLRRVPDFSVVTRAQVDIAIEDFKEIGRVEFLKKYAGTASVKYFIQIDDLQVDAKPVLLHALRQNEGYETLAPGDFPGNVETVKIPLENLGYVIADRLSRRYWQVNHKSTGKQAEELGMLFAPKVTSKGTETVYYKNMTQVKVGDLVFSYWNSMIQSIGVVQENPVDGGNPFDVDQWNQDGRVIKVTFNKIETPFRPKEHISLIRPLLTISPAPLDVNGNGVMGYLTEISAELADFYVGISEGNYMSSNAVQPDETYLLRIKELSTHLSWPIDKTADVVNSLLDKSPQIILTGPPGTGKTHCAKFVAKHALGIGLNEETDRITTVQFHPSYGYEDFIEGLRPEPSESGFRFRETPGKLLKMIDDINEDGEARVLIVDEINRANIPRVFGEMMYLLEYRDEKIDLMYRASVSLPHNLYIIGTMNTADKSVRGIDLAMRRRFDFFTIDPDYSVIEKWYESENLNEMGPDLWIGFQKLNQVISEKLQSTDLSIGHSFFMDRHIDKIRLRAIWNYQIKPLINEYFFSWNQKEIDEMFTVEKFWPV